jgi:hypothetical protein
MNLQELQREVVPLLRPYASRISVFGSIARGDDHAASDIDLLIRLRPTGQRPHLGLRWFGLESELAQKLGRSVEMVIEEALSPYVRPFVEADCVVLYEAG